MNVIPVPLPGGRTLARDYIQSYESVDHLYGGDFRNVESRRHRMEWLDCTENSRADRIKVAETLLAYNTKHNPHAAVAASIALLKQPGTLVVTGGQQSGLFTGPLLVVYKAITTILAAKEARENLGRPVVPIFWIAGEDHDWDEVDHTYVLNRTTEISKIRMEDPEGPRSSVSAIDVHQENWTQVVDKLDAMLQDSEFKAQIMEFVRDSSAGAVSMTDAFASLMGSLFGKFGLILLDSADTELRKLEQPFFQALIMENDQLEQAYLHSAADITSSGYELQADVTKGAANLFYIHEGARLLLLKKDGVYTDRKNQVSFSQEELLAVLEAHPERFSNNVLTRPLMQDYILPVLTTVLGQGEMSYWAITKQAFETLGGQMPLLLPRMSFTVVEGTLHKHMDKYGLSFVDVLGGLRDKKQQWLNAQDELEIERRFEEAKAAFTALYDPLIEQLGTIQAGLLKLGSSNKDKIVDQISFLQAKARDAMEKQNEAALRQWERIELSLLPLGKLQERVYNVMYYLNRYGPAWLDELADLPPDFSGTHRIIYM
ncbi:bacillithiol biosynthesis cysteine-adding enzyme BshC [Paenibacillus wynnii]|uniref:bacillithiol biosynthesis cysteine-adding enzyme BshC n=1 Tax=Paenibacillus wynnii TaxID=268407 RepID=UPI00278E88D6|nr:bacillithiol biosynthesis cysteine-adding enzyme BshC [Paenibacillus wynnii]MDQ0192587.1 bacillithiol biosynthesis cysteine-adding enzyme BshC [Paenibacillus wynnii]